MHSKSILSLVGILILVLITLILSLTLPSKDEGWCSKDLSAGHCKPYNKDDTCYCIEKPTTSDLTTLSEGSNEFCEKNGGTLAISNTNDLMTWLAKRLYLMGIDQALIGLRQLDSVWYWMKSDGKEAAAHLLWRTDVPQNHNHTNAAINVESIITQSDDYYGYKIYNFDFYMDSDQSYQWYGIVSIDNINTNQIYHICQYVTSFDNKKQKEVIKESGGEQHNQKFIAEKNKVTKTTPQAVITVEDGDPCECSLYEQIDLFELGESKEIRSPGYPKGYCYNQKCGWLINTHQDMVIRLKWIAFNTEDKMDFAFIYDARFEDYSKLLVSCTGTDCTDQTSSGQSMYVQFISDHVTQDIGFKALATAVDSDMCYCSKSEEVYLGSTDESYLFSSPKICTNQDCKWKITAATGYGLQIIWNKFSIGSFASVHVFDGQSLLQKCAGLNCDDLITENVQLIVHFISQNQTDTTSRFGALVKVVQNFCAKDDLLIPAGSVLYTKERNDTNIAIEGIATLICPPKHKLKDTDSEVTDAVLCISPHWSQQFRECIPVCSLSMSAVTENSQVLTVCHFGNILETLLVPSGHSVTVEQQNLTSRERISTREYTCNNGVWSPATIPVCIKMIKAILVLAEDLVKNQESLQLYVPGHAIRELTSIQGLSAHPPITALLPNRNVLVIDGLSSMKINPNTGQVTSGPNTNKNHGHGGAAVLNGLVYLCAGHLDIPSTCEAYNGTGWALVGGQMQQGRLNAQMVAVNASLYMIGGFQLGLDTLTGSSMVERYSPETAVWELVEPMWQARFEFGLAVLEGLVYACGGNYEWGDDGLNSCETYNPSTDVWNYLPALMVERRYNFAMVSLDGKLYALGGEYSYETDLLYQDGTKSTVMLHTRTATVESYSPLTNVWEKEPIDLHQAISAHAAVTVWVPEGFNNAYSSISMN